MFGPTVTRYLDQLGRVVRVRTESFASVHDIREDIRFDSRGRVLRRSAPHFANATAPNTSYEHGVEYIHPTNPHHSVRVMPGRPNHKYVNSRHPYVRWDKNGKALDVDGNEVSKFTDEAHIPLEKFRFNPDLFK